MTLVPWNSGLTLVWDATCPDTFAASYRGQTTAEADGVVDHVEERKSGKYSHLSPTYLFQPVAIETSRSIWSPHTDLPGVCISGVRGSELHQLPPPDTLCGSAVGKRGSSPGVCPPTLTTLYTCIVLYCIVLYCIVLYCIAFLFFYSMSSFAAPSNKKNNNIEAIICCK